MRIAGMEAGKNDEISNVRRIIALNAPCDLVESHHHLTSWAKDECDGSLRVLYTANAHQASIPFRYLMFEQRLRGTRIAIHQHGGGYGVDETHIGEEHDIAISDRFYSWGWNRPELGDRVRPLATAMPGKRQEKSDRGYLLMSLPVTSNFYRFQPFLLPQHVTHSVSETTSFVVNLTSSTKIRLRSSGAAVFPTSSFGSVRAKLTIDDGQRPGPWEAGRSQLVIHNYLGTSWLETLAMNVPTVCFYDPAIYRAREAARPFIDALQRVGVIHHSGADAARFVNDLKGDPSSWWSKPEVQDAREKFVARYANFTDNWLPGWIEEFERLLEE
jgi:putative transferase (TIGR04331 family)